MSAVEVILAALAAGAGVGAKDTASAAVKDAYSGLKGLLRHRLSSQDGEAIRVLEAGNETASGMWQARLGEALTASGVDRDEQVIAAAHGLLQLADPTGWAACKYQVDAREAKGVQVGDYNTQHNTFS